MSCSQYNFSSLYKTEAITADSLDQVQMLTDVANSNENEKEVNLLSLYENYAVDRIYNIVLLDCLWCRCTGRWKRREA